MKHYADISIIGRCEKCGSDDLMLIIPGEEGPEYGTDWVIKSLLREHVTPIDEDGEFEDCMASCYPETTSIGFLTVDTVTAMKELDPIAWDLAKSEYVDGLVSDEEAVTFDGGSTYYRVSDIEQFLDEQEEEPGEAS